jgi:glycine cleavage system aminomethyltransferase T
MGMERLVEHQPQNYLGKDALESIRHTGVDRKLVGVFLESDQLRAELSEVWPVFVNGKRLGQMTDAVWSPGLEKNIGYAWVPIELAAPGTPLDIVNEDGVELVGVTAGLPFVDPEKKVPTRSLADA